MLMFMYMSAVREVVGEQGMATSWLELLHLCNARVSTWSAAAEKPLPSMEIASTLRGAAFAPADLVAGRGLGAGP